MYVPIPMFTARLIAKNHDLCLKSYKNNKYILYFHKRFDWSNESYFNEGRCTDRETKSLLLII